jgi:hypothetical protein
MFSAVNKVVDARNYHFRVLTFAETFILKLLTVAYLNGFTFHLVILFLCLQLIIISYDA